MCKRDYSARNDEEAVMSSEVQQSVRASDADRERVATIVSNAVGQGMLTLGEADERLARVWAARHLEDLAPITADLPDGGRRLAPIDLRARAAARAGLARHVALYLAGVAVLVALWLASDTRFFWPAWPIIGFGLGVLSHARAVRRAGDPAADAAVAPVRAGRPYGHRGHRGYGRGYGCGGYRHRGPAARA
jgi:hypothetical protein